MHSDLFAPGHCRYRYQSAFRCELSVNGETAFGVLENSISSDTVEWLRSNGTVTQYKTSGELLEAVNDPSTQMIGVLQAGNAIQTFLSGDELEVNQKIADTLPQIYENRKGRLSFDKTVIPVKKENEGVKSLFIVLTLVTAMFMGCTFNAMNIISEKEDGIEPDQSGASYDYKILCGSEDTFRFSRRYCFDHYNSIDLYADRVGASIAVSADCPALRLYFSLGRAVHRIFL